LFTSTSTRALAFITRALATRTRAFITRALALAQYLEL
jgi:hypothetical protein